MNLISFRNFLWPFCVIFWLRSWLSKELEDLPVSISPGIGLQFAFKMYVLTWGDSSVANMLAVQA